MQQNFFHMDNYDSVLECRSASECFPHYKAINHHGLHIYRWLAHIQGYATYTHLLMPQRTTRKSGALFTSIYSNIGQIAEASACGLHARKRSSYDRSTHLEGMYVYVDSERDKELSKRGGLGTWFTVGSFRTSLCHWDRCGSVEVRFND